jgi:hypothetical protein
MHHATTILAVTCIAASAQLARGQLIYEQDTREIFAEAERYWLLNGFPIQHETESDLSGPAPDFSAFDDGVAAAIEVDEHTYFRSSATQVSVLTPTSITGSGSVRAEVGQSAPSCDDEYYSIVNGFSRVYVEFAIEDESLVELRAEQTMVQGSGQVSVQFRPVDGELFLSLALSAATTDLYEGTHRLQPGSYRLIVWNSIDVYCQPGASERSDFETSMLLLGSPCNTADQAAPVGVLDLADVQAFIGAFTTGDALADIAEPAGVLDLADVQAFVGAFIAGCP